MNKFRIGLLLLSAAAVDLVLIHLSMWRRKDSMESWIFSLLLPILLIAGCFLIGKGLSEKREIVYDYRHSQAPDSERPVR